MQNVQMTWGRSRLVTVLPVRDSDSNTPRLLRTFTAGSRTLVHTQPSSATSAATTLAALLLRSTTVTVVATGTTTFFSSHFIILNFFSLFPCSISGTVQFPGDQVIRAQDGNARSDTPTPTRAHTHAHLLARTPCSCLFAMACRTMDRGLCWHPIVFSFFVARLA